MSRRVLCVGGRAQTQNRNRLQCGLRDRLRGATLLQPDIGEISVRQSSLGIEIEGSVKLRDRVVEAPGFRVTGSERAPGGRAQRIERNSFLPELDRFVVATEDGGESRTREEHVHVAGSEIEGALEFDIRSLQVPVAALEDHAETDVSLGEIR